MHFNGFTQQVQSHKIIICYYMVIFHQLGTRRHTGCSEIVQKMATQNLLYSYSNIVKIVSHHF